MTPVVRYGQIGVGVLSIPPRALDIFAASNIWPGVFAYQTPLERILTDQVLGGLGGPLKLPTERLTS